MTDRQKATEILETFYSLGIEPDQILEHIVFNFLSGKEALEAMEDCKDEFLPGYDDDDDYDYDGGIIVGGELRG